MSTRDVSGQFTGKGWIPCSEMSTSPMCTRPWTFSGFQPPLPWPQGLGTGSVSPCGVNHGAWGVLPAAPLPGSIDSNSDPIHFGILTVL